MPNLSIMRSHPGKPWCTQTLGGLLSNAERVKPLLTEARSNHNLHPQMGNACRGKRKKVMVKRTNGEATKLTSDKQCQAPTRT